MAKQFEMGGLDPSELKQSLRDFLKSQDDFKDYNFEGSALSTIIDLLVRNTHYQAFLNKMLANESFLDSAQLRSSVVSHARKLNYRPKSRTAPTAIVDLIIYPADTGSLASSISVAKDTQFLVNVDGKIYPFVTTQSYIGYRIDGSRYEVKNVQIKQGTLTTTRWEYKGGSQIFEIPNENVDTSTLKVYVKATKTSQIESRWQLVQNTFDLDSESESYFLYENTDGKFQIEFGDNILGKSLEYGNYITVEYITVQNDEILNGAKEFNLVSTIAGYTNVQVDVVQQAAGGSERESTESIRSQAPKFYSTQNRAVTANDYATILISSYPAIKSAFAWGGEENPVPQFGKVFIAVIPNDGFNITKTVQDNIVKTILKPFNVGSITPVIVNSQRIDLDLSLNVRINPGRTSLTPAEVFEKVSNYIVLYSDSELEKFSASFYRSQFEKYLLDTNPELDSVNVTATMKINFQPDFTVAENQKFDFNNAISPGSVLFDKVFLKGVTLGGGESLIIRDNSKGSLVVYKVVSGEERVFQQSVGSVDYDAGVVQLNPLDLYYDNVNVLPTSYNVKALPLNRDIVSEREYVLYLDQAEITETD